MTAMPSYITARTSEKSNPSKFCMKEIIARNNLCQKRRTEMEILRAFSGRVGAFATLMKTFL